jgi:hypothetical protein
MEGSKRGKLLHPKPVIFGNSRLQNLTGTAWLGPMPADTSDPQSPAETPHYHGHRMRLRERFHGAGPDALSDYELLEMVLFAARARGDVKPLAKMLIKTFGSFAEVMHAPEARLREVDGVGDKTVTQLKLIAAAASRIAKGQLKQRTLLSSWADLIDYCRTSMAFADKEQFRIQARAGAIRHRRYPGAQPPLRRSDAVAGGYPDDQGHHRHRHSPRHRRARSHHRRQERACQHEGDEADLA